MTPTRIRLRLAFLLVVVVCGLSSVSQAQNQNENENGRLPTSQLLALQKLYNSTGGPGWRMQANWNNGHDPCLVTRTWYGVICNAIFHEKSFTWTVKSISLPYNGLIGTLDASVGDFPDLLFLDLHNNPSLSGEIPTSICGLENLQVLKLSQCNFAGQLPECWTSLPRIESISFAQNEHLIGNLPEIAPDQLHLLQSLDLSFTNLNGSLPENIGVVQSLERLDLSFNRFSGTIPITIGDLQNVLSVSLNNNQFEGSIPYEVGQMKALKKIDLSSNKLSGTIPTTFGRLNNLRVLCLRNNQLSGSIPSGISELFSLSELDLSNNLLTGSIPDEIGSIELLDTLLDLSNNQISGTIHISFNKFSGLRTINLAHNLIGQIFPIGFSVSLQSCKYLNISNNNLEGPWSHFATAKFKLLRWLDLHGNNISGSLTGESLSVSPSVDFLDLSFNALNSSLEDNFFDSVAGIAYLNLGHNLFSGTMPSTIEATKSFDLLVIDFSHNLFEGLVPMETYQRFASLRYLDLSHNQLSMHFEIPVQLQHLEILDISHNALTSFGNDQKWPSLLKVLDLSYNSMQHIPLQIRSCCMFGCSTHILIEDNPITCFSPPDWADCADPYCMAEDLNKLLLWIFILCSTLLCVLCTMSVSLASASTHTRERILKWLGMYRVNYETLVFRRSVISRCNQFAISTAIAQTLISIYWLFVVIWIYFDSLESFSMRDSTKSCLFLGALLGIFFSSLKIAYLKRQRRQFLILSWVWSCVVILFPLYLSSPFAFDTDQIIFSFLPYLLSIMFLMLEMTGSVASVVIGFVVENRMIGYSELKDVHLIRRDNNHNGAIQHATYRDGRVFLKSSSKHALIRHEFDILKNFIHENIVQLVGICFHRSQAILVTRYIHGEQALKYCKKLGEGEREATVMHIGAQLCEALQEIHSSGFAHRDITSNNIMIERTRGNLNAVLVDFGNAEPWDITYGSFSGENVHLSYEPPELRYPINSDDPLDLRQADVFQLGISLWEMAVGSIWNWSGDINDINDIIMMVRPKRLRMIIESCLNENPSERPTVINLQNRLRSRARTRSTMPSFSHFDSVPTLQPYGQPNFFSDSSEPTFTSSEGSSSSGSSSSSSSNSLVDTNPLISSSFSLSSFSSMGSRENRGAPPDISRDKFIEEINSDAPIEGERHPLFSGSFTLG